MHTFCFFPIIRRSDLIFSSMSWRRAIGSLTCLKAQSCSMVRTLRWHAGAARFTVRHALLLLLLVAQLSVLCRTRVDDSVLEHNALWV